MSKLSKILLAQMALSPEAPYRMSFDSKSKRNEPPKKDGKPTSKVVYYTDENGNIRRKKIQLEEEE